MAILIIDKIFMLLTITFYYVCAVYYIVICVSGKYSLFYDLELYFRLFCLGSTEQKEVHQLLNLGLCSRILCYGKTLKS